MTYTFELSRPIPNSKTWMRKSVDLTGPLEPYQVLTVLEGGRWCEQGIVLHDRETIVFGPERAIRHLAYLIWTKDWYPSYFDQDRDKGLFMLTNAEPGVGTNPVWIDPFEVVTRSQLIGAEPELNFDDVEIDFTKTVNEPVQSVPRRQRVVNPLNAVRRYWGYASQMGCIYSKPSREEAIESVAKSTTAGATAYRVFAIPVDRCDLIESLETYVGEIDQRSPKNVRDALIKRISKR